MTIYSPSSASLQMPITTGHKKVQTNSMKTYRRSRQYTYHPCQPGRVAPGLGLLVSVCILMLPMLVLVDEHVQLTMYHMNPINQWSVHPHHMTFNHTPLLLPSLNNVLPAMALQSRVVRSNTSPSYTSSSLWCPSCPPHSVSQSSLWSGEEGGGCGVGSTATDEWGH